MSESGYPPCSNPSCIPCTVKPAAVGERPRLDIRTCGSQAFPFLILLPLAEKITGSWDVTTAGIGAEVLGSSIFWMQLIVIYLFAFSARCVDRGLKILQWAA